MRSSKMKFKELEYKYRADHISVGQFLDFVSTHGTIVDIVTARGTDYFFSNGDSGFIRYRNGGGWNDNCELTLKRNTSTANNWNRVEVDIPLNKGRADYDTIKAFASEIGYKFKFSLTKLNYVVRTPGIIYAYYIVNGKDKYLEIEADKGAFKSEEEAFDVLRAREIELGELGITHNNRTKKSLFDMYKEENG
jgi:hypothetical protein